MTDTTSDLIQRLAGELDTWMMAHHHGGVPPEIQHAATLVAAARVYLAQPEPEGLTEEEIEEHFQRWWFDEGSGMRPSNGEDQEAHVRRVSQIAWSNGAYVARCGRPAVEPVPVSERPILKSSNFNDANGHCWCGTRTSIDKTGDIPIEMPSSWELREPCAQDDCVLPHYALPVPTTTPTETP